MINFSLLLENSNLLITGMIVSLQIAFLSFFIGTSFGICFGILQMTEHKTIKFLIQTYTTFVSGTPRLMLVFLVLFLLPKIGLFLSPFWCVVTALGMDSAAYITKTVYKKLKTNVLQIEAAETLGISRVTMAYRILLPQATKKMIPILFDELARLLKASSLGSVIGVTEFVKSGKILQNKTYDVFTIFFCMIFVYVALTALISFLGRFLAGRRQIC